MRPSTRENKLTAQIESDLKAYQAKGGKIVTVPQGISSYSPEGKKCSRDNFVINGVDGRRRFKK